MNFREDFHFGMKSLMKQNVNIIHFLSMKETFPEPALHSFPALIKNLTLSNVL